jgi:hypothetical protein
MESQQRPKNLTPSLLWGDLAARATSGEAHMMDSCVDFKNYFGQQESFSLRFCYKGIPPRHKPSRRRHTTHGGIDVSKECKVLRP